MNYSKPIILISKCLEFEACRYDGQIITNQYIHNLKKYVHFITVCPEVEIGLGVPRDPINLINSNMKISLFQSTTKKDFSAKMKKFAKKYINSISFIDGMILKSKSPSCAISTAKHYTNIKAKQIMGKGPGLFADQLIKKFPYIPKEEDSRLNDIFLREHFYTSIFIIADFRNVKTFKDLYDFHTRHKLIFMAYNQIKLYKLGRLAANHDEKKIRVVLNEYYKLLLDIFIKRPRYVSHINTQMHAFGYYKKQLSKKEKKYFLDLLEDYRKKKIPASTINSVLHSWNIKFENKYLLNQSYFAPFPEKLVKLKEARMQ